MTRPQALPAPLSPRRKLALSLAVNVATRIPGAAGLFLILPLLRRDLGIERYGLLLGALALGAMSTVLFGGFNAIGRRLIGEAHAARDSQGEADALVSLLAVNGGASAAALAAAAAYATMQPDPWRLFLIASLASSAAFANTFDNARAAFNEHYVTALLQIAFQAALIALTFLVRPIRTDPVLAALAIQGHLLLASTIGAAHLVRARPHLLRGSAGKAGWILRRGLGVGMAEGLVAASLGGSVVWLQASAGGALAGWYATLVRLFQTLAVPVVLLLMPLSSYIRLGWNTRDARGQRRVLQAAAVGGLAYGALAAIALAAASVLYIEGVLALPGPGSAPVLAAIFALFAAVIAYRSYAMVAYAVSDAAHLGGWIGGGVLASCGIAALAAAVCTPIEAVAVNAALLSVVLLAGMLASHCRR